jgi:hypothetical protein
VPLEILHRAAPCRNVPVTFTLDVMVNVSGVLEERVLQLLAALPPAESGRNEWGVLWFKWPAPIAALDALWLSVKAREVTLSCRVAHVHFSKTRYLPDTLTNRKLKERIARDAVKEAERFLRGEIAVAAECTNDGSLGASMWCPAGQLAGALQRVAEVLGERRHNAWTWRGEVAC